MPGVEPGGIVGESFKEVWLPGVMKANHDEMMAGMAPMPKGMKMTMPEYEPPWTSLGQAPTDAQVKDSAYGGCA